MQLARACLGEKEKTDFEILAKIENRKLVSKPIGDHLLLTNEELAQLSAEIESLSKSLELLEGKEDRLKLDQLENCELKAENELLKHQIDFVTSKISQVDVDSETFRNVKAYSLAKIDKFHTINTQWQEDELTGVHITLNSLQSKNEDSLARWLFVLRRFRRHFQYWANFGRTDIKSQLAEKIKPFDAKQKKEN